MKRLISAAALAAGAVVAASPAAAVPIGSDNACGVGQLQGQGQDSCRFIDAGSIGVGGYTDTGWTLTHKEKTASCVNHVTVIATSTVTDDGGGSGPIGSQPGLTAGVTYTLSIQGNGFAVAGAPGSTPATPADSEPADTAVDNTGGAVAGAAC